MGSNKQKDNSTFGEKLKLRRSALAHISDPIVMETHGGLGAVWSKCYSHLPLGIVLEKDPKRTEVLAHQRPTWAVYEGDSAKALAAGVGSHLCFLFSERPFPAILHIVVNDGIRQSVSVTGGWRYNTLRSLIDRFGNGLHSSYLECCQILMDEKAAQAGYRLSRWHGYYCGYNQQMTHYWAVLEQG